MTKILVVDDEESIRESFQKILTNDKNRVEVAVGIMDAKTFISMNDFDVAVIDRILANGQNGIDLAKYINRIQPSCETIIMSAYPTFKSAIETLQLNTFSYLTKPIKKEDLCDVVKNAAANGKRKKEAKQYEEILQSVLNTTNSGIMICDQTLKVLSANPAFKQILGYQEADIMDRRVDGLPYWEGANEDEEIIKHIKKEPGKTWEIKWKTGDDREIDIVLSQSLCGNVMGGLDCLLIIIHDVTELRHMEGYIKNAQKMQSLGMIARMMAHNMCNIIMVILSYSELLNDELSEETGLKKPVKEILKASKRADILLKQVLAIAKEASGEKKIIDIGPFLKDILNRTERIYGNLITIKNAISEDCINIMGDTHQLYLMMTNLITNSVQAIGKNKGVIEVTLQPITFKKRKVINEATLKKGTYALIEITDNGSGMDEKTKEFIFEPFFTTRKDQGGKGVGLTIVHEIVQRHKGVITAESKPGKGTNISLYFPVHA